MSQMQLIKILANQNCRGSESPITCYKQGGGPCHFTVTRGLTG